MKRPQKKKQKKKILPFLLEKRKRGKENQ